MSNVETTELKLKTTPTGGVDASHSPYYRRLLSAGYKGFLQGTIGGASLYGTMGLVIGGLVALPLMLVPGVNVMAAAAIIPLAAGVGIIKGATTFGNIGSTAAINAESADLTEQRRYLLDRYYDLPEGPEGDREAEEIKKELLRARDSAETRPPFWHWKTVAVCALAGAALMLGAAAIVAFLPEAAAVAFLGHAGIVGMISEAVTSIGGASAIMGAGATAGALTGSVIGIDRYYIRKWFDKTEGVVHGSSHKESALRERSELVGRLKAAAVEDEKTKVMIGKQNAALAANAAGVTPATPNAPASPPQLEIKAAEQTKPDTKISEATLNRRLADLQEIMAGPAI